MLRFSFCYMDKIANFEIKLQSFFLKRYYLNDINDDIF
jgi:hypothetical protein